MIDVVYLAYQNKDIGYDIGVVETFLNSYKKYPAGIKHNFHIIAKNWTDKEDYEKVCEIAKENNAKIIDLPDDGFDIGAYFRAAKILTGEYVFFMGSNVELVAKDWLLKIYDAHKKNPSLQLIGPLGSWESGLSGIYPNPHIRTVAFFIKRKLLLEYAATQKFPQTKEDTWALEHCSNSLSNFILKKKYKMAVVNTDGKVFSPPKWHLSRTYATPDADKMFLTDKWARGYYTADEILKLKIEMVNWGKCYSIFPQNFVSEYSDKINIFIPYSITMPVYSTKVFHPFFIGDYAQKLNTPALKDYTDKNISNKSDKYGELTSYYWILKNYLPKTESKYVGFCQASRFLDFDIECKSKAPFMPVFTANFDAIFEKYSEEKILECIDGYDVILPEKTAFSASIYEKSIASHKKEIFNVAINVMKKLHPEYSKTVDEVLASNKMYLPGGFVMKKELLTEFLEWLFEILFEVEKTTNSKAHGKYKDMPDSKFILEIFINIWLAYKLKNDNIKIKTTTSYLVYFEMQEYMQACLAELEALKKIANSG